MKRDSQGPTKKGAKGIEAQGCPTKTAGFSDTKSLPTQQVSSKEFNIFFASPS